MRKLPSLRCLTKRLELRPLQMRDDRAWWATHAAMLPPKSPWEIPRLKLTELSFPKFMEVLNRQKAEALTGERYTLGIFHKEVGTLLGYIYIEDFDRNDETSAVLDFRLINIYWKKGFAKEAVTEAMKLKSVLKIDKLTLNPKSKSKLKL